MRSGSAMSSLLLLPFVFRPDIVVLLLISNAHQVIVLYEAGHFKETYLSVRASLISKKNT